MDDKVQIIQGQGVYDTPVRISRTLLQKQKRVILASGESYPDALTATSLVEGQYPVFFVKENSLPVMVGNEILRLEAEEVYILGGPNTISAKVEEEIMALKPSIRIKRLAGPTRYETAVEVAKERPRKNAILVDGLGFPDALTAQGLAYIKDQALILTEPKGLPQASKIFLESIGYLDIGGGPNSVGPEVLEDLRAIGLNPDKTYQGPNRFATAAALAEEFVYMRGEPNTIILASGDTYQNALASSILSQKYQAPTLLLGSKGVDKATYNFLTKYRESIDKIVFVGNPDDYSSELFSYLEACILDGGPDPGVFAPYEALKQGSKGENVKLFHQKLKEKNYYRGKVDDVFDAESEIALRLFLYNNNLPMDSSLSEQAWTMIKNGEGRTIDRSAREKITIKVPYHSQIDGIHAWVSCVPTSLLMALQNKGYAMEYNLKSFLEFIPRHPTNPAKGYAGNPYKRTAVSPSMWPNVQKQTADMLGAKSSDLTGAPMYALEDELYMNNPVVIIPTLYWRAPDIRTYIVEGKPTKLYYNLHGTVLTGYDPATGKYQVTDPYNHPSWGGKPGVPHIMWISGSAMTKSYETQKQAFTVWSENK